MRCSRSIRLMLVCGLALTAISVLPSCARSDKRDVALSRARVPSESEVAVAATTPRLIIADGEVVTYSWNAYNHMVMSNSAGGYLYDFMAGPTCRAATPPGSTTVEVELHRSAITPKITTGGSYIRGTWPVPTTRRVRGTTHTFDEAGVTVEYPYTYQGGLVVYTDLQRDIVFVEPVAADRPSDASMSITVLKSNGDVQSTMTIEPGFYYIFTNGSGNTTLVSEPYPWNSTGQPMAHNTLAKAVFQHLRAAAMASGVASMKDLPPLVGP